MNNLHIFMHLTFWFGMLLKSIQKKNVKCMARTFKNTSNSLNSINMMTKKKKTNENKMKFIFNTHEILFIMHSPRKIIRFNGFDTTPCGTLASFKMCRSGPCIKLDIVVILFLHSSRTFNEFTFVSLYFPFRFEAK